MPFTLRCPSNHTWKADTNAKGQKCPECGLDCVTIYSRTETTDKNGHPVAEKPRTDGGAVPRMG